ncbi:MAG: manganese efflux pump MntP family protein [Acutalibacteraceae bacterium]
MDFVSAVGIGTALAADASAVSLSYGSSDKHFSVKTAVVTALTFGIFQMLMPVLGWSIGKVGSSFVQDYDHLIAFAILAFLGIKMIYDSRCKNDIEKDFPQGHRLRVLAAMAFATSIDALTSGIILPSAVGADTPFTMFLTISIIGIITFLLSLTGFFLGRRFRTLSPTTAEIFGGVVLIVIGVKTLLTG